MAPSRLEIDRILCPVDFSELSGPALERAVRLGAWFDARVEVLHVIPCLPLTMPADLGQACPPGPVALADLQRHRAAQSLAGLVAPFLGGGAAIETRVLEGDPRSIIQEEAEALPADLMVMGTHGRSRLEHLLFGSVTEKELRRAPCPVLTVSRGVPPLPAGPLFRRILCAADLTRASEQTLDLAFSLAAEGDAQVTLLHVIDTPPGDTWAGLLLAVPEVGPSSHPFVTQARADLRKAAAHGPPSLRSVIERVETGAPASEILRLAGEIDADLIVLGAHPRGALGRMLFGSTTSQVVRRAKCPVLVVHETRHPLAQEMPSSRGDGRARRPARAFSGAAGPIQGSTPAGMAPAACPGEVRVATTRRRTRRWVIETN